MVDEIVKLVAKKTKMPEAVAKIAVDTVLSALKKKLPPNVSGIVDSLLDGGSSKKSSTKKKKDDNPLGDLSSIAGKLLGKK
jgi:hypothetical protein